METVSFRPSESFRASVHGLLEATARQLRVTFPRADVQEIGGTAVPGLLTKGDLDVNLRVPQGDFDRAVEYLTDNYRVHQKQNWKSTYASFVAEKSEPPLGIQLTVLGDLEDRFVAHRDRLRADPALVEEFNQFKQRYEGAVMGEYQEAKQQFVAEHLDAGL